MSKVLLGTRHGETQAVTLLSTALKLITLHATCIYVQYMKAYTNSRMFLKICTAKSCMVSFLRFSAYLGVLLCHVRRFTHRRTTRRENHASTKKGAALFFVWSLRVRPLAAIENPEEGWRQNVWPSRNRPHFHPDAKFARMSYELCVTHKWTKP